ncbi:right-handed parallel beta-helix repeat-containing protein [Gimesia algae]|uniref:Probable pectate lyase C n=1 Tax=Gimesia algae TaxID=2527971 RepID=A0A517VMF7_9PLAN|nr:right-handed parallel beta-helix repeat-containing protein [Gimesia algae]QDT94090.1 putative outer membrane protein PmpB precursor [Gimesia algae]
MLYSLWLTSLKRQLSNRCSRSRRLRRDRHSGNQTPSAQALVSRNLIETLEDRTLLTAFTVVNSDDSGAGSLRDAIEAANANAGADTISFDAALAGETIVLSTELQITDDLTITGLGADQLTLDGNADSRIFRIDDGVVSSDINVEISGLTLTNGSAENGGAIYNLEMLSIVDSTLTGNTATQYGGGIYFSQADQVSVSNTTFESNYAFSGGAIYSIEGSLSIDESHFSQNHATGEYGGAIYFSGVSAHIDQSQFIENYSEANGGAIYAFNGNLTVTASQFTENEAKSLGGGIQLIVADVTINESTFFSNKAGAGGAINILGKGSLDVSSSTFTENTALSGGAINNNGADSISIENSTLSYNQASHQGGALFTFVNTAVSVVNSTIIGNEATYFSGGGIYRHDTSGSFLLQNSIVAGNTSDQFSGSYTGSNNIIQSSLDGLLDPVLRDNGGPAETHALLTGSAAIDAGNNSAVLTAGLTQDQRGFVFKRIYGDFVDIGAYEFQPLELVVDTADDLDDGDYSAGHLSLREAIKLSNTYLTADTITFASALAGQTIALNSELLISDNITIIGLGADQLTISGNNTNRIFNLDDGDSETRITVEMSGLTLTNGFADSGGAILNYENLTITDSTISKNQAAMNIFNGGGGIYSAAGSLTVMGSIFTENSAFNGGGIYALETLLTVSGSTFSNNSADRGGGIFFDAPYSNYTFTANVTNSTFSENVTDGNGAGILFDFGQAFVDHCTFTGNISDRSGGGIGNLWTELTVQNSSFDHNSARLYGAGIANGSFFDFECGGDLLILNCTLWENQATNCGGGFFTNCGNVDIVNTTISGNSAKTSGAIYTLNMGPGAVVINNSTITGNSATYLGGISGTWVSVTIKNSIIAGNPTEDGRPQNLSLRSDTNNIIQDSIEGLLDPVLRDNGGPTKTHALLPLSAAINAGDNSAATNVGLIHDQRGTGFPRIFDGIVDIGAFESESLHFLVDSATDTDDGNYSAGNLSLREAIKLSNESPTTDIIAFDASLFDQTLMIYNELVVTDDVTIIGHGAAHLTLSSDGTRRLFRIDDGDAETSISVELSDFTLTNGFANYSSGGAIHSLETLSISDVVFADNQASVLNGPLYSGSYGGAIYSAGDLTVTNSTFVRNSADWYGGAIYSTEGLLSITGCDFTENQTSYAGGAIVAQNGDLTVSASTFTENSSDTLGGGIFINEGVLTVGETDFTQNSSSTGGAIYHQISSTFPPVFTELSIADCTFQGNTTTSAGGAVYFSSGLSLYRSYYTAFIEDSHFSENSASFGGALYLRAYNLLLTGSTFFNNSASLYGGAISDYSDNLTIQNSLFEKNSAKSWGGGIYSQGSLVLQNSTLSGNTALVVGGGIAFDHLSYDWEIINSTLTGNAASRIGGGIYAFPGLYGTITNSIVAGNTAASTPQVIYHVKKTNSIVQDSVAGLLDPVLRDNGGVTKTHALLPGSAAINGGNNSALDDTNPLIINRRAITEDQRGAGFERIAGETIDIGAFEVQHTFAQIELRMVDEKTTTQSNGEQTTLPDNLTWIDEWSGYWLEIWISTPTANDLGVLSAAMNLSYNTTITTATAIEYGAAFTVHQTGTINDLAGVIENLSAETSLTDVGDDQRVLFARIRFESTASDGIDLDLTGQLMIPKSPEFTVHQTEVQLVGSIATQEVHGPAPETLVFANPYDLNDDDKINYRDLIQLVRVYGVTPSEANSDYAWFADYDQNDRVNYRDLILLVNNYGKSKARQSNVNYSQGFPDTWNRHLTVEPTLLPQLNARPVEQASAETTLNSVVESLDPQLTPAENEKLAQVDIEIVDLPEGVLSNTVQGTIYIDVNAAGYGWFVDNTPDDNSEFYATGPYTLVSAPFGNMNALGKIDLRTVILHELGHLLGYEHADDGVMQESLVPGERRLADWESEADAFFADLTADQEFTAF